MNGKEWSLIAFTLSMQFSAGVILIYDLFLLFPLFRSRIEIPGRFQWILVIASATAVLGMAFSLFHLGNPANSIRTLANLKDSWLSREILSVLIFTGMTAAVTVLHFLLPTPGRPLKWAVDLTAVTGLLMIFFMSRVYMIPTRPAWNSFFTPWGFFLTAIILGVSFLLLFQLNRGSWASLKILAILTIAIPAIQLATLPVYLSWLGQLGEQGNLGLSILLTQHLAAFYLRLVFYLLAIGFGLWTLFSIRSDTLQNRFLFTPAVLAWISIIGASVMDRILFYSQNTGPGGF